MQLDIKDLVPYEPAAVASSYNHVRTLLKAGRESEVEKPKVIQVDNEWMVRDGNSTVKAYADEDRSSIECDVMEVRAQEMLPFRDALVENLRYKGFSNFPVAGSKGERAKLYERYEAITRAIMFCFTFKQLERV